MDNKQKTLFKHALSNENENEAFAALRKLRKMGIKEIPQSGTQQSSDIEQTKILYQRYMDSEYQRSVLRMDYNKALFANNQLIKRIQSAEYSLVFWKTIAICNSVGVFLVYLHKVFY